MHGCGTAPCQVLSSSSLQELHEKNAQGEEKAGPAPKGRESLRGPARARGTRMEPTSKINKVSMGQLRKHLSFHVIRFIFPCLLVSTPRKQLVHGLTVP